MTPNTKRACLLERLRRDTVSVRMRSAILQDVADDLGDRELRRLMNDAQCAFEAVDRRITDLTTDTPKDRT